MSWSPGHARVRRTGHPAAWRRLFSGAILGLAVAGCRGVPAASGGATAGSAESPPTVHRLVEPPVRDRIVHGPWTITARGTEVWFDDGVDIHRRDLGGGSPVVALAVHAGLVHAVDRDGRVVRFEGESPGVPRVLEPAAEAEIGAVDAAPRLASLDGELLLLHGQRIVRWTADARVIRRRLECPADAAATDAVLLGGERLIAAGRRVQRADDGRFVGSASRLRIAPPAADWPGPVLYARTAAAGQSAGGEVGAMDERLREIDRERWRLPLAAPVRGLAFDRGLAVVAAGDAVLVLGVVDGRLAVVSAATLTPGSRVLAIGPDAAGILRPGGDVDPVPGSAAAPPGSSPANPPGIVDPVAAAFDGRVLRVWTADGVVDVGLDGRRRAIDPATAGSPRDDARITPTIATRRGGLTLSGAPPGTEGFAAIDGLAWAAAPGRLRLVDPADGRVLADVPVSGVPRWIAPLPGGEGSLVLTTGGEVVRVRPGSARRRGRRRADGGGSAAGP